MKKITQILFTLLLSMLATNAFARTVTEDFKASTSVTNPEHQFYIIGVENSYYWGDNSQPVSSKDDATLYVFIETAENSGIYNIYNVAKGTWGTYTPLSSYNKASPQKGVDKATNRIVWTATTRPTADDHTAWFRFSKTTARESVSCYNIEVAQTDGAAGGCYLQWYGGLSGSHTSVGWHVKDAATDNGSGWSLIEKKSSITYAVEVFGNTTNGGVVYGGKTYKNGESIEVSSEITLSDVSVASVSNYETLVSFKNNTFTVRYAKKFDSSKKYYLKVKDSDPVCYLNIDYLPATYESKHASVIWATTESEALQITSNGNCKWSFKNGADKYVGISTYYTNKATSEFKWTIDGNDTDGYYLYHEDAYVGYFGYESSKRSYCHKSRAEATCFVLEEVKAAQHTVTYVLNGIDASKWQQEYTVIDGEPYPTPTNSNPFITLDATSFPTGTVTADVTKTINYTANYTCFSNLTSVTQWYAFDIHGNTDASGRGDYPVYAKADNDIVYAYDNTDKALTNRKVANGTADDYQNGSVMNDYFAWAFIGNPFDGVKVYNKGKEAYIYFDGVPSGVTDRTQAPATFVSDVADASVFTPINTTDKTIANAFCLQNKTASLSTKNILNQKCYVVSGYQNADGGSAMRAWPINYTTGTVNRTLAAEYGTIIVPFYAAIPDGITVYSCDSVAGNVLGLVEQTAIYPNVPYIIKGTAGTEYTFTCPTTGSYTDPATKGLLTGVYETTELQTIAQAAGADNTAYVLALQNSRVAFCSLEDKEYSNTLPANYCYLTLKNEAGSEVKSVLFFDEETGINDVDVDVDVDGKFFENGRIVIVKNNAKYNVAGQMIK